MAKNVTVQVLGGTKAVGQEANTVRDVKRQFGAEQYTASVNGSPAGDDTTLRDNDFISLSQAVKGGQ